MAEIRAFEVKFVGREKEQKNFSNLLANPKGERRTLLIQGPGGQGKTWLIKNLLDIASQDKKILTLAPGQLVDMYSTSNRHLEGVWNTLVARLQDHFRSDIFECYQQAQQDLESSRKQEEYSEEALTHKVKTLGDAFRSCLLTLTQKQTIVLAFDTFENVQASEVGDWILSNDGLQMPNLICLIGTRLPLSDEQKKAYTAVQELRLSGLPDEEAIDFYCRYTNTIGISGKHKEFITELNQSAGRNPLLFGLAIFWLDLPDNTVEALRELSSEKFERGIAGWLSPRRGSGPVLIGQFQYNEQMRQVLVFMAYLNRRFNFFFLEKLVMAGYINMEGVSAHDLWDALEKRKSDFFYVKERPDGEIQLHDKLAEMLRKYVLDEAFNDSTGQRLRQFMDQVVEWYDALIQNAPSKEILYAEQLAYLLRSDLYSDCLQMQSPPEICTNLPTYAPQPKKVIEILDAHRCRRSDVLARLILNEIKIPLIGQFDDASQSQIFKLLGQIAQQSYLHPIAQIHWEKAFEAAQRSDNFDQQVEALTGQHNSTFQTDPKKSLDLLIQAHQICQEHQATRNLPIVLYEIGFVYFHMQDLEESTKWYEMAKRQAAILENAAIMPILLNDEGYNYLLMGDIARARVSIRTAGNLRLREYNELKEKRDGPNGMVFEDQFRNAALMLGLSYSTMGDLGRFSGRLDEATRRYSEALELFEEARSAYWQTRMYFSRGESYRRRAVTAYQDERLDASNEFEQNATNDIERSFHLCQQLGYVPDSITAIRRMGRLYHDKMFRTSEVTKKTEYLKKAREQFDQALQIAQSHRATLEILENLTEIAFLGDDNLMIAKRDFPQEFETRRRQASKDIQNLENYIANLPKKERIYQFPVFVHLLELEQAAYYFVLEDYSKAFESYLEGYKGLAQKRGYGVARYLQHMDHLIKQLRVLHNLDRDLCMKWCQDFLTAWEEAGLTEKRHELPQEIEMFMDTAFLYLND